MNNRVFFTGIQKFVLIPEIMIFESSAARQNAANHCRCRFKRRFPRNNMQTKQGAPSVRPPARPCFQCFCPMRSSAKEIPARRRTGCRQPPIQSGRVVIAGCRPGIKRHRGAETPGCAGNAGPPGPLLCDRDRIRPDGLSSPGSNAPPPRCLNQIGHVQNATNDAVTAIENIHKIARSIADRVQIADFLEKVRAA